MEFIRMFLFGVFLWTALSSFQTARRSAEPVENALAGERKTAAKVSKAPAKAASKPAPPTFVRASARLGDDLPSLLERYGLHDYECNITQFFKINRLREDYRVKTGAIYNLPIQVVTYNGKSIRSTLDIKDWQTAKRIENYNLLMRTKGLRGDHFIESKKLWVPWHELNCPGTVEVAQAALPTAKAELPPLNLASTTIVKGSRSFPLFGKKYAKTPLISSKLKGRVFYVVSGHGGPDVGAQGKRAGHTLCEDEYAYDVSLRLARLLISHGATAYMVVRDPNDGIRDEAYLRCDKDEEVWGSRAIPRPQKERLRQRTDLINDLTERHRKAGAKRQTLVEIHVDSRSRDTKTDVFFYHRPGCEPSRLLAKQVQKTFLQKYMKVRGQRRYNGTVGPRHLFMLNETETPTAVYIELGNIRNDYDQQRLVITSNRQALANWIAEALLDQN
jgi:N-acetylmuramoyl-L-alanine amidase